MINICIFYFVLLGDIIIFLGIEKRKKSATKQGELGLEIN